MDSSVNCIADGNAIRDIYVGVNPALYNVRVRMPKVSQKGKATTILRLLSNLYYDLNLDNTVESNKRQPQFVDIY